MGSFVRGKSGHNFIRTPYTVQCRPWDSLRGFTPPSSPCGALLPCCSTSIRRVTARRWHGGPVAAARLPPPQQARGVRCPRMMMPASSHGLPALRSIVRRNQCWPHGHRHVERNIYIHAHDRARPRRVGVCVRCDLAPRNPLTRALTARDSSFVCTCAESANDTSGTVTSFGSIELSDLQLSRSSS